MPQLRHFLPQAGHIFSRSRCGGLQPHPPQKVFNDDLAGDGLGDMFVPDMGAGDGFWGRGGYLDVAAFTPESCVASLM